ncbi:ABC transporter B family member 29, chloroplastic isoform X4 [Triticum aestivum]|uniref:ABC transporter B family member 29, chloroplastic isoform X4 n=1 Tax=Triticum aestivum TaxID=4565 RepID=UPI001D0191A8|nr:ABC transporter B family member 29, chloroplastic-like isoform X4 [Triticum aestivum]
MAMAMANPAPLPTFSSQSRAFTPSISLRSSRAISRSRALALTATTACSIRLRVRAAKDCSPPSYPLSEVFPYVAAEWRTIAKGWACAAAAVYCLSRTVPAAGRLPRALAAGVGGGVSAEVSRGVVALAAFASARAAAAYVQQALLWEAALRAVWRLRERAFERLLARDLAFFDGREGIAAGDIAHRITDEADDVADAVYSVLNTIVPTSLQLIAMGTQMVAINPQLSLVAAMVLPSMLTVKVNNGEHKEMLRFHELAFLDLKNNLALALFVEPIQDFGKAYNEYKQGEPALERIFDLTRFIPEVRDKPSALHLNSVKGDIKFHDVTFRYVAGMPPIVDGVNLHIRAGETIAIVGPSGGGKTTLAKLLLRLYHPQSGYIALDNHDIQDIQLQCLRTHIAFVSQDPMLFSGTIAQNIAYGDPVGDTNMRKVENAAKIANADEFIKILPEGYDSYVGQRGSSLSGGQKQRLSIARAIYQNSSILVLDEATSALDSRSELLLKEALMNLMASHTVVIIAHRLEMILMADRIVLLEGGKLREITRSAFLSLDGRFGSPPDLLSRELGEA